MTEQSSTSSTVTNAEEERPKRRIEFAHHDRARSLLVPLDWPLCVDGVRIDAVTLRRMTGAEVLALAELQVREDFDDFTLFAMVADQPADVLRALDEDDWLEVRDRGLDFLPRRFRVAAGSTGSQPGA